MIKRTRNDHMLRITPDRIPRKMLNHAITQITSTWYKVSPCYDDEGQKGCNSATMPDTRRTNDQDKQ